MKQLGELIDCVNDLCDPAQGGTSVYVGLEHIPTGAFSLGPVGSPADVRSTKSRFRRGDILYGKLRPYLDKAVLAASDGICSTDVLVLRPKPGFCAAYLLGLVHSKAFLAHAASTTKGVNHPRTSWAGLSSFTWEVPPKPTQEKLGAVLWKVQRAVQVEDRLIAAVRELKQAAMRELFTRGLRGEALKESVIGPVPGSWGVVSLGDSARIGNGSTPSRTTAGYWNAGTIPWLTSGKIHEGVISTPDEFVTELAVRDCHLPLVKAGSVLVAITGQGKTLGNAAIVTFDTCVSQHLASVEVIRSDVYPQFVWQYLRSRYGHLRQIGHSGGSTKGALTCASLRNYAIPLPAIEEQREIVSILVAIDNKVAVHDQKRSLLQDLFKTLLTDLMTGRIRVADLDIDVSEVTAA